MKHTPTPAYYTVCRALNAAYLLRNNKFCEKTYHWPTGTVRYAAKGDA